MERFIYALRYEDLEDVEHTHIFDSVKKCVDKALEMVYASGIVNYYECIEIIRYNLEDGIELSEALEYDVIELQNKDIIWDFKNKKDVGILQTVKERAINTAILWGLSVQDICSLCIWYGRRNVKDDTEYIFTLADGCDDTDDIKIINSSKDFDDLIEDIFRYHLPEGHELGLIISTDESGVCEVDMHIIRNSNNFVSVDTLKLIKEAIDEILERVDISDIAKYTATKFLNDIILNIGGIDNE